MFRMVMEALTSEYLILNTVEPVQATNYESHIYKHLRKNSM